MINYLQERKSDLQEKMIIQQRKDFEEKTNQLRKDFEEKTNQQRKVNNFLKKEIMTLKNVSKQFTKILITHLFSPF